MTLRSPRPRLAFNRRELAGAFGDIGTDLPLLGGMLLAMQAQLSAEDFISLVAGALIMFGFAQIVSGLSFGIPMPVQPLKAMAAIVIAQGLAPEVLFGGGLVVGAVMMLLSLSGVLEPLFRFVRVPADRGSGAMT